jgi:hypothetical protein
MPGGHVGLRFVMGLTVSFDPNTTKRRFAGDASGERRVTDRSISVFRT